MATTKTISAALKLVDSKKENLKKAYDDLQSHSSLLSSSFPLSWSHLDSHFTSLHNTLTQRFLHLQSLESQSRNHQNNNPSDPSPSPLKLPNPDPKNPNFPSFPNDPSSSSNPTTQNGTAALPTTSHVEALNALCKNNDGRGLRDYVGEHLKDKVVIKDELQGALKFASDPAAMVLDSVDGVVGANSMKDEKDLRLIKRSCNVLFQQLRVFSPYVSGDVRKKAKRLFVEWKGSLASESSDPAWTMAFLHFVAAYGFLSDLNVGELATFSAMAAAIDELPDLYQIIGLTDKVPGIVQKLIDKNKHVLAVKCIFQFNLADKIPPVPILKAYVDDLQKLARRLSDEGKSWNEIKSRQIHSLKAVIKVIQSYNLDSEYPCAILEQRIKELNSVKYAAPAFSANPSQHPQQQSGIKRPRTSAPVGPAAVPNNVSSASSTIHQYQQPHFHSTGLLPEHPNPYMSSQAMPYGMTPPTQTFSSYTGPSTGPYGLDGVPMGPSSGNLDQGGSYPNSSEPHAVSGYYDSASAYGGYGLQQYYQTSYPQ